jgi:hypothetical protein
MEAMNVIKKAKVIADRFIDFVNASVSPYHAVGKYSNNIKTYSIRFLFPNGFFTIILDLIIIITIYI